MDVSDNQDKSLDPVLVDIWQEVPLKTMQHWYEMLGKIQGVNVRYSDDQMKMANEAIREMRMMAIRIQTDIGNILALHTRGID